MSTRQDSFCSNAAEEFCRTEKTYLASLEVLVECYLKPVMNGTQDAPRKEKLEQFLGLVLRIVFCHKVLDSKIQEELVKQQAAVKELQRLSSIASKSDRTMSVATATTASAETRPTSEAERVSSTLSDSAEMMQSSPMSERDSTQPQTFGSLILTNSSDFKAFGRLLTDFPKLLLEMSSSFKDPYSEYIMQHEKHVGLLEESLRLVSVQQLMRGSTLGNDRVQSTADADVSEQGYQSFEQQTQRLVDHQRVTQEAFIENGGVDLSLAALMNAPLKRLTNYNLLTQEWISGMEKKKQEVPEDTFKAQKSISAILKAAEHGITLVRAAERLKVLEEKYKIPGLASRESEIIVEAPMTRGTREKPGSQKWKTRPCYLLVTTTSMYVIKLDGSGEKAAARSHEVIPLHRMEQMLLKPKAKDVTRFFLDNVGMHIKYRVDKKKLSSKKEHDKKRESSTSSRVQSQTTFDDASSPKSDGSGGGVDVSELEEDEGVRELFLLNEDKLLVQGWDQKVKFAVNTAVSNWQMKDQCRLD